MYILAQSIKTGSANEMPVVQQLWTGSKPKVQIKKRITRSRAAAAGEATPGETTETENEGLGSSGRFNLIKEAGRRLGDGVTGYVPCIIDLEQAEP